MSFFNERLRVLGRQLGIHQSWESACERNRIFAALLPLGRESFDTVMRQS